MARKSLPGSRPQAFLSTVGHGKSLVTCPKKQILFFQGKPADAVFYIEAGQIRLSVVSHQGKEAVVAILEAGDFLGEGCIAGQLVYMATYRIRLFRRTGYKQQHTKHNSTRRKP